MNKLEFLDKLRARLKALSTEDVSSSADYYGEMIDDRIEDGMSEEDAIAALGELDDIVKEILREIPLHRIVREKAKNRRHLRTWEIVLISAGSPLWVPILIAFAAAVLAVYIATWAIVLSCYAVTLALAVSSVACLLGGCAAFVLMGVGEGLFLIGAALIIASLAILALLGCNGFAKGVVYLGKKIILGIKRCIIGKGDKI